MQIHFLILMLILVSCTTRSDNQAGTDSQTHKIAIPQSSARYLQDTLVHNGITLVQVWKDDRFVSLRTIAGDTIIREADYYHSIAFPDIDKDGDKDVRVSVISNTPNQCENFFFDEQSGRYTRIENSDLDIERLKGANLFYSYNRAGCADMNWESHLSKIEDWREVSIGFINAKGCGDKDDGIYIYQLQDGKQTLLEKLRIDSVLTEANDKLAFIKTYWEKNYKEFQK